jgi:hypothetical protein
VPGSFPFCPYVVLSLAPVPWFTGHVFLVIHLCSVISCIGRGFLFMARVLAVLLVHVKLSHLLFVIILSDLFNKYLCFVSFSLIFCVIYIIPTLASG